jgi:aspartate dehydrogenase
MTLNVAIVGLGAIGNFLIDRITESQDFKLLAVYDIVPESYDVLCDRLDSPPPFFEIVDFPSETDVFIECASVHAVTPVVTESMKRGITAIVASIGGLIDNNSLWELIEYSSGKLILPSGAIGGLDILKAVPPEDLKEVTLVTRKNPKSLPSELGEIKSETEIFSGNAREAIKKYPKNINVAAILALAGPGVENTKVRIVADPSIDHNIHEISIKSECGDYFIRCMNFPFEINPKTSKLAALSIWASLVSLTSKVTYGL